MREFWRDTRKVCAHYVLSRHMFESANSPLKQLSSDPTCSLIYRFVVLLTVCVVSKIKTLFSYRSQNR
jgi:hypothetical protein